MTKRARHVAWIVGCALFAVACGSSDDDSTSDPKQGAKPSAKKKADASVDPGDGSDSDAATAAAIKDAGGSSTCDSRDCWCEMFCANVAAADCPADQPQPDCEQQCKTAMTPGCETEDLAVIECQASRPQSAFSCDINQHIYTVKGCETEQDTFNTCLFM